MCNTQCVLALRASVGSVRPICFSSQFPFSKQCLLAKLFCSPFSISCSSQPLGAAGAPRATQREALQYTARLAPPEKSWEIEIANGPARKNSRVLFGFSLSGFIGAPFKKFHVLQAFNSLYNIKFREGNPNKTRKREPEKHPGIFSGGAKFAISISQHKLKQVGRLAMRKLHAVPGLTACFSVL